VPPDTGTGAVVLLVVLAGVAGADIDEADDIDGVVVIEPTTELLAGGLGAAVANASEPVNTTATVGLGVPVTASAAMRNWVNISWLGGLIAPTMPDAQ
jgi:hypothetical protein